MDKLKFTDDYKIKNHSRKVRDTAEEIKKKSLKGLLIDEAPNRELIEGITIDKRTSKDLDDGIWAEKTRDGYAIFISIADVAEIIKPNTILDKDAYSRSTSVYTSSHTYHMFPSEISTDLCSLNNKTKRYALTTRICLDKNFNTLNSRIFESCFYNRKRFNYDDFNNQFNDYSAEFYNELNLFHTIAKGLYNKRIGKGARPDYREHVALKVGIKNLNAKNTANFVVQEFMIAKNIEDTRINFKEKINGISRLHMPQLKGYITSNKEFDRAFYSHNFGYHYGLGEDFYGHYTSPIRRYADLINHRQHKSWIRKEKEEYSINEIRKIVIGINSKIENTLNLEKIYNKEVYFKRAERFLKKLSETNYDNISSVSNEKFASLIRYIIHNPSYFDVKNIYDEIIYRIDNNLLSNKSIGQMMSSPKTITQINSIKEFITEKNNT